MIELNNGIIIKSYTKKGSSDGLAYYLGITTEGREYGFVDKDIAKTSRDKVRQFKDEYEWHLYKNNKKTQG